MKNYKEKLDTFLDVKTETKLTGCAVPFRTTLLILNGAFILISLGLIGLSIFAFVTFHTLGAIISTDIPTGLLLVAIIMLTVATIGFIGTLRNNRCLLMIYFSVLVLMMIGQFVVAILSVHSKSGVTGMLRTGWETEFNHNQENLNFFQAVFCCCGFNNTGDYAVDNCSNATTISYTGSSSSNKTLTCDLSAHMGNNGTWSGCGEKLEDFWNSKMNLITGVSIAVGCLELVAVLFSLILFFCISCCSWEEETHDPYANNDEDVPFIRQGRSREERLLK
eukprot:TRINITY_DN1154_c0_g1_i1.p1 TRINITY_DN1154_c0_g1~~TRINITY_DN1154_c0_g1_i1.p1  ORF type:complete len:305 (-),score=26.70 TRINITY_DN1154_c0_g1_i1:115-948(-)